MEQNDNKKEEILIGKKPVSKGQKILIAALVCVVVSMNVAGWLVFFGLFRDPVVSIRDDSMRISGIYGLRVDYSEIDSITLIDNCVCHIYCGDSSMMTRGFDGFGRVRKGRFWSENLGSHILFVQIHSSPTIHIERHGSRDIYISFLSSERTEQLYQELTQAMARNV